MLLPKEDCREDHCLVRSAIREKKTQVNFHEIWIGAYPEPVGKKNS